LTAERRKIEEDLEDFVFNNAFHPILTKNSFWVAEIIENSKRDGFRNILTGQAGNYTITWNGSNFYIDLFFRLKIIDLIREVTSELRNSKSKYQIIKTIFLVPLYLHFKSIKTSFLRISRNQNPFLNLSNEKRKKGFQKKIQEKINFLKTNLVSNQIFKKNLQANILSFTGISWYLLSCKKNVQISDPTTDLRLINFLDSIPQNLFFKNGQRKYIFKKSFSGFLPREILENSKRQVQAADFELRFKDYAANYNLSIEEIYQPEKQYFDLHKIQSYFDHIKKQPPLGPSKITIVQFLKAFSLINFFSKSKYLTFEKNKKRWKN
jgi:hypothetical protein